MTPPPPPRRRLPLLVALLAGLAAQAPCAHGYDAFTLTPSAAGELNLSAVPPPASPSEFGRAVAVSADGLCMLVGAPAHNGGVGGVAFFSRAARGAPWAHAANLSLPTGSPAPQKFGASVALSPDCSVAAVGAWLTASFAGRVWIYERGAAPAAGFTLLQTIASPQAGSSQRFGTSVALDGSAEGLRLAVGATGWRTTSATDQTGAVFVCERAVRGALFQCSGPLARPDTLQLLDLLGSSVQLAASGLVIVAGAPGVGKALAWVRQNASQPAGAAASWGVAQQLFAAPCSWPSQSNYNYGWAVAVSADGNTLSVGSPVGGAVKGAVVVFERNSTNPQFVCTAVLKPSRGVLGDGVGHSTALTADATHAFVGSPGMLQVVVYNRTVPSGPWREVGALRPPSTGMNWNFASYGSISVDPEGLSAVVGAYGAGVGGSGLAFAFDRPRPDAPSPSASSSPAIPSPSASVSTSPGASPVSASATPSPSVTVSETPSATPSFSASISASTTPSPSATPTVTASVASSATPSPSATPSVTASVTASATPSPSATPSITASVTSSITPSASTASSASASQSLSASPTPSNAASQTSANSPSRSATASRSFGAVADLGAAASASGPSTGASVPAIAAGVVVVLVIAAVAIVFQRWRAARSRIRRARSSPFRRRDVGEAVVVAQPQAARLPSSLTTPFASSSKDAAAAGGAAAVAAARTGHASRAARSSGSGV
jgi:hypothetical protein